MLLLASAILTASILFYLRSQSVAQRIEQKRRMENKIFLHHFEIEISDDGKVVRAPKYLNLENKNVLSNPRLSSVFQKAQDRAMRGGGFVTFNWPTVHGMVENHIAYASLINDNTVLYVEKRA